MSLRRWLGVAPSSLLGGARLLTSGTGLPDFVRLVEVGPRDGLQNEPTQVETVAKLNLIGKLAESGLRTVEATAFVSPKWVPQMADHKEVLSHVMAAASGSDFSATSFPVLVPNLRGIESAVKCGATEVAVFASASETFSKRNINCTVEESLERFRPVFDCARANGVRVRGYVSCVVGCPYEGAVSEKAVSALARDLVDMGCYEVSLGDTIGVGSPGSVERMLREVARDTSPDRLAVHFHDTYGQALANILTSLRLGISVVDSSVGGLGGCPYAKGASGNVATEDVLYMVHGLGIETGVDLHQVARAGEYICGVLGRETQSKAGRAVLLREGEREGEEG